MQQESEQARNDRIYGNRTTTLGSPANPNQRTATDELGDEKLKALIEEDTNQGLKDIFASNPLHFRNDVLHGKYDAMLPHAYKTGGMVQGPGTATSDSIPAQLSNNEYVIPAHVVMKKGTDFFDKMLESNAPKGQGMKAPVQNGVLHAAQGTLGGVKLEEQKSWDTASQPTVTQPTVTQPTVTQPVTTPKLGGVVNYVNETPALNPEIQKDVDKQFQNQAADDQAKMDSKLANVHQQVDQRQKAEANAANSRAYDASQRVPLPTETNTPAQVQAQTQVDASQRVPLPTETNTPAQVQAQTQVLPDVGGMKKPVEMTYDGVPINASEVPEAKYYNKPSDPNIKREDVPAEKQFSMLPNGAVDQALAPPPAPDLTVNAPSPILGMRKGFPDYGYGNRHQEPNSATPVQPKAQGFFGEVRRPDGRVSTELTQNFGKGEIPSMVPGLSSSELSNMMNNKFTPETDAKAQSYAAFRQLSGQSPFAGVNDTPQLLPAADGKETMVSNLGAGPLDNRPTVGQGMRPVEAPTSDPSFTDKLGGYASRIIPDFKTGVNSTAKYLMGDAGVDDIQSVPKAVLGDNYFNPNQRDVVKEGFNAPTHYGLAGQLYHGAQGFANSMFGQQTPVANSTPEYQQGLANAIAGRNATAYGDKMRAADAVKQGAIDKTERPAKAGTDAWNDANVKKLNVGEASRQEATRQGMRDKENTIAQSRRPITSILGRPLSYWTPEFINAVANLQDKTSNPGGMTPAQVQAQANYNQTMQFQREGRTLAQDERTQNNDEQKASVAREAKKADYKSIDDFANTFYDYQNPNTGKGIEGQYTTIRNNSPAYFGMFGTSEGDVSEKTSLAFKSKLSDLGVPTSQLDNLGIQLNSSNPKIIELFDVNGANNPDGSRKIKHSGSLAGMLKKVRDGSWEGSR